MCTICDFEKPINNFHKRYSECKDCSPTRGLERYYKKKMKYQINRKHTMKKIEKK